MIPANSSAKTAKPYRSSKKKKPPKKPRLKLVPCVSPYLQKDILEQIDIIGKLAKEGKISSAVLYYEFHDGNYRVHCTGCEDTLRTGTILMKLGLMRLGH
jgi:hypothetical protein